MGVIDLDSRLTKLEKSGIPDARVDGIIDQIDDEIIPAINTIDNKFNITTDEIVLGSFNGKTLYQKYMFLENYALANGINNIPLNINILDMLDYSVYITNSTHLVLRKIVASEYDAINQLSVLYHYDTKAIEIISNTEWATPNIIIKIVYTKEV